MFLGKKLAMEDQLTNILKHDQSTDEDDDVNEILGRGKRTKKARMLHSDDDYEVCSQRLLTYFATSRVETHYAPITLP